MQAPTTSPRHPEPIGSYVSPSKAYSPGQIAGAAFVGSPLAGCVLLASNYRLFGLPDERNNALVWGCVGTVAAFAITFVLPESFPSVVMPFAYVAALYQIATYTQGSLFEAHMASGGAKHSNWRVFAIASLCSIGVSIVILIAVIVFSPDVLRETGTVF
jgi:hypothetical protein